MRAEFDAAIWVLRIQDPPWRGKADFNGASFLKMQLMCKCTVSLASIDPQQRRLSMVRTLEARIFKHSPLRPNLAFCHLQGK